MKLVFLEKRNNFCIGRISSVYEKFWYMAKALEIGTRVLGL
jgi:hypothetical protein